MCQPRMAKISKVRKRSHIFAVKKLHAAHLASKSAERCIGSMTEWLKGRNMDHVARIAIVHALDAERHREQLKINKL